ncbi:MAG: hypothetical protein K9L68_15165, partial [Spirochaetales bacterium]|nr:hypothetical protein [Spirochaetales bacterium]MCF7939932.1 hypothetical protein [Spirochaetales bacterium]
AEAPEKGKKGDSKTEAVSKENTTVNKEDADWGIWYTLWMASPQGDDSKSFDLEFKNGPTWNNDIPAMVFQTKERANHPVFQYWNRYFSLNEYGKVFPSESEVTIMQFGEQPYTKMPSFGTLIIIPQEVTGTGTYEGIGSDLYKPEGSTQIDLLPIELEIEITEYSDKIVKGTFSGKSLGESDSPSNKWENGEFVCNNAGDWDPSVLSSESEEELWEKLPGWATSELNSQLNSDYNGDFELLSLNNVREISSSHYEVTVTVRVGSTVNQVTLPLQR